MTRKLILVLSIFALIVCNIGFIDNTVLAEETEEETSDIQNLSDLSISYGSYLYANKVTIDQISKEIKHFLTPNTGHGWAGEKANYYDYKFKGIFEGYKTIPAGDSNVKNGADIVLKYKSGAEVWIQDKYYKSAQDSVNAAFDNGKYKYTYGKNNDQPMALEVPKDQYEEAIKLMTERIKKGEVDNVPYPNDAEASARELVRQGSVTYQQAVNIAKPLNIDSLKYDVKTGIVSTACVAGITFALDFTTSMLSGEKFEEALGHSSLVALKSGGIAMFSDVALKQLARTGAWETMNNTAKAILPSAMFVVLYEVPDIIDYCKGRVSGKQLMINLVIAVAGTAAGVAVSKAIAGAAYGSIPTVGQVIMIIIGAGVTATATTTALTELSELLTTTDSEAMSDIISQVFADCCEEYYISEYEAEAITSRLQKDLAGDTIKDMFASEDKEEFALSVIKPIFEETINGRETVATPTNYEIREMYINQLGNEIAIH